MELSEERRRGIGVALNEADWVGITVEPAGHRVTVAFDVLTSPAREARTELVLDGVGRVAASLRHGRWDDPAAPVQPFGLGELPGVVRGFGGCPIYGWEFIDPPERDWLEWRDRLSLDVAFRPAPGRHVLELFQEGDTEPPRHLDLRVWFDALRVTRGGAELPVQEFIDGGRRWWNALWAGDPRTGGTGIAPVR
ncbi:hypothetical protein [Actinoplanes teichomyceticus]|uniref:hypothetical protein n=1 Tax=Actinoplanes teichomyceticus TaxID=1867 RepID=UPI0011A203C1|nr:hypothetical protein [Actinoplanes teichomyceticus]